MIPELTEREKKIVEFLKLGYCNKQIAEELNLDYGVVKQSLCRLYAKVGLPTGVDSGSKRIRLVFIFNSRRKEPDLSCLSSLTPREKEIALLVGDGLPNAKIGEAFGITERTIKNTLRDIFDKMGVWTRLQLALRIYGAKNG